MNETLQEYRSAVEAQANDLLSVVRSVASGDLHVEVPVPPAGEGIQVLTELASSIDSMVDELRAMMAEQEQARAEVERGRLQLAATLKELLAVQRRYLEEQWDRYTETESNMRGYYRYGDEDGPTADAWLPAMTTAVLRDDTVTESGSSETLAFPIQLRGEMIGVVGLSRDEAQTWSEDEIAVAKTIMDEVAEALDKQRLLDETQRRAWQLETSNEIGRTISSTLEMETLLRQIVDTIKVRFGYYYVAIMLVEGDEIVFQEGTAIGDSEARLEPRGRAMDLDAPTGMIVEAVQTGQPVLANNVLDDPRYFPVPEMPNTRAELDVPILVAGRVIGVLDVQSNLPFSFTEDDMILLQALANQAGVAIENARLFHEAQLYAEEQTILRQISQTVGESLEMQELLETALDVVLTAIGFEAGLVSLSREDSDDLYLAAQRGLPEPLARKLRLDGLRGTLCDYVFQTGETIAIADVREGAPVDVTGVIRAGLLTYAGTPLVHRDRQLGTFCFFDPDVHRLDERDLLLLEAIGRQIGVGVANARLFQQSEAALGEVEAAHQSYLRRGWQEHLRQRDMLGRSGFVYQSSGSGPDEEVVAVPDLWKPEMERAVAEGGPAVVQDSEEEQERAGVAVPITLRGQTLGVVGIETEAGDRQWTEDEIALLAAVSEQLGQALESARLFADTERSAERERLIGDITAKIRASTDVQNILETTAEELGRVLGTSRTLVRLAPTRPGSGSPGEAVPEDGPPAAGRQLMDEEPGHGEG
jgi:GAF domain-containing protein